jgi:putative FmdB family regulatory protein
LPLYEYQCSKCGKRIERIRKFSDPPLSKCPHCGGKLERLVSSSSFQLKGSGWYATDYGRKPASSDSSKAGSPSAGDQKKSSEPAKKAEPSTTPSSKHEPKA